MVHNLQTDTVRCAHVGEAGIIGLISVHMFVRRIVALSAIVLAAPLLAPGQASGAEVAKEEAYSTKELHQGVIPLKDYGGDLATRSNLLGDWGGLRSELAHAASSRRC